ncbi:MAG TPA: flagellar hook-associated protein FlgK [Xanthobacteraceae bacterium]|jgi:flagellar hook-associated protein 1 FlgK|nr:flagellar hook-associated protein FlgK [Xanthobacteraceae bacterium]
MGINQALSAALSGIAVTQQAISVIAGNVSNANTAGYVDESVNQSELGTAGKSGSSVESDGINRNLNTLLQNQLWTETSGGSYADTVAQFYQQLQDVYGTPGSTTSFDAMFNNFTTALQSLSTGPSSYSSQSEVLSAAQSLAQNLNSMTTSVQELRTQTEAGIATDVQSANGLLQNIAQINTKLEGTGSNPDSTAAALEDQRDQDITQLSQLMNVNVMPGSNNQIAVYTGTGLQLVNAGQVSQLTFGNAGTLSATSLWSADPSQDGAGTITLTAPGGATTDLISDGAFQSGQIGAYLQMRDTILPQAQAQLDDFANQMSQALSNQTVNGTAATSGGLNGFNVDVGSLSPGNTAQFTYTDSGNVQHTITVVDTPPGTSLPQQASASNPNNTTIGIDFSAGISSVVSQLNLAFGSNLQFSNPSGTLLQVVNANGSGNVVNSMSATSTVTSLTSGSPSVQLFVDGTQPITGALTSTGGTQTTGLAGRISVNTALLNSPGNLVAYAANTTAGDATRPSFLLNQMTTASLTYAASTGIGTAQAPYSGTLSQYLSQVVSVQSQAANAATNLQQGQDTVLTALQQRFNSQSGVNIDTEMSNLIALQNAYSANARVMSTIQSMMQTLLQIGGG